MVRAEQLRAHYAQIPAMAIAQTAGGLFTAWVLWEVVNQRYLVVGIGLVMLLSTARLLMYRSYFKQNRSRDDSARWGAIAVAAALVSGCIWGAAAPLLYPPQQPEYRVFLVVLLTLLPIIPVAALAAFLPAFYAYALPCLTPFIVTLALRDNRPEHMAALLLVMMMAAMLTFAHRYSRNLAEAIRLRVSLAQKSDALQQAIEHKTRFIAAASHDLRQPVHAMGLFLEVLRHDPSARLDDSISHLEASQRNLRTMLGNMLDISKLDAAVVEPRLQDFHIDELMQRLSSEFAPLAAHKQLDFRCRPSGLAVRSDELLLERIVRNLLANALTYTGQGGVLLACRRVGGMVRLQVFDTGVGIGAEQRPTLFLAFNQLGNLPRRNADGLGLGLAIVRQMADLLEHRVSLRSTPGRGSVFSVDVPLADGLPASLPAKSVAAEGPDGMPGCLVMILDDDAAVCEGTSRLLGQWGHRTIVCRSTEHALASMRQQRREPDMLLADFALGSGQDGLSAVASIQRSMTQPIPVILITGDTAPARIREAYAAGHFLLHKPVNPQRLRACMAEAWLLARSAAATRSPDGA